VAVSPAYVTDATLFAASNGGGIFKSTDGGDSWSPANSGLPQHLYMDQVAFSPSYDSDGTVYASFSWVYESTDRGETWTQLGSSSWNRYAPALAVTPDSPLTVFAGTDGQSLWRYNTVTPIELTSFEATLAGGNVVLGWITGWESHVLGFHVKRAATGTIDDAVRVSDTLIPGGRREYEFVDDAVPPGRHWYWLEEVTRSGDLNEYGPKIVMVPSHGNALALAQNTPNPFKGSTEIAFHVQAAGRVTLRVYDITGRLVRALIDDEIVAAGRHVIPWDGRGYDGGAVPSGIYVYRLAAGEREIERKLQIVR
jgi:hypothetical protein